VKGEWVKSSDTRLRELIGKSLEIPGEVRVTGYSILEVRDNAVDIEATILYEREKTSQTLQVPVKKIKTLCLECSRRSGGYYEAVLQYRGEDEIGVAMKDLLRVEKVRGGLDYYFMSKEEAEKTGKKLKEQGYAIKKSFKTVGVTRDGKRKTRCYISVKPPQYRKGDIVSLENRTLKILKTGVKVTCQDLGSGNRISVPASKFRNAIVIKNITECKAVLTEKTPTYYSIMDLKSFDQHDIKGRTGKKQGAILVELGYLSPKDLFWGVKFQVHEIILSLFRWGTGEFVRAIPIGVSVSRTRNSRAGF